MLATVQLKGISVIRDAFCTGIQLLLAIIDAETPERAEKVTLTFEVHMLQIGAFFADPVAHT